MAGKFNPTKLSWAHDGKNTDESNFDPAQFFGWEVELNGTPALSIPLGWETDGTYEAPIAAMSLAEGAYTLRIRLLTKIPEIKSDWSPAVQFEIRKVPTRPLALSVA